MPTSRPTTNDDIRSSVQRVIDNPDDRDNVKAMVAAIKNTNASEIDLSRGHEGGLRINGMVAALIGSAVAEANKGRQDGNTIKSFNFFGQEIDSDVAIQALTKGTGIQSLNLNENRKLPFDAHLALANASLGELKISSTSVRDFNEEQKT